MRRHTRPRAAVLAALALLCPLAAGCSLLTDQTDEANKLVDEVNSLRQRAAEIDKQAEAKEGQIAALDVAGERARINELSKEQAELYRQSAGLYREGADKAEQASRLKVDQWFKDYLGLKAQQLRKAAEITDVQRRQSEAWLGGQPFDGVKAEIERLNEEVKKLSGEMAELNQRVTKAEEENRERIKK